MSLKRKLQGGPADVSGKRSRFAVVKNCVTLLNELRPTAQYRVLTKEGPAHASRFSVSVEFDGCQYVGEASSKRCAKLMAAQAALASFIQFRDMSEVQRTLTASGYQHPDGQQCDFTSDDVPSVTQPVMSGAGDRLPLQPESIDPAEDGAVTEAGTDTDRRTPEKNAVQLLHELRAGLQFQLEEETGRAHDKHFTMSVVVDSHSFQGVGCNKRTAKSNAAKQALIKLFGYRFYGNVPILSTGDDVSDLDMSQQLETTTTTAHESTPISQQMVDEIGRLVMERFESLMACRPTHSRRKVLAGMVMSRSQQRSSSANCIDGRQMSVVAVSTGTKCLKGECMSESGLSLNDSHAEVVARRCLLAFFYDQLHLLQLKSNGLQGNGQANGACANGGTTANDHASRPDDCIFELRPEGRGYRLKQDVRFHLYISTAPCGDARIFSPHEDHLTVDDKHPNRRARGQLRAKIEAGEGTIPMKSGDDVQTWDGVLQGVRLLTMSCSDKLARWNVVGVQGSLLSLYVEPVYLASLTLGGLFHRSHLARAMGSRVSHTLVGLPAPFRLHTPLLTRVTKPEPRQPGKASNYSINWTYGQTMPEVISAISGKDELGRPSRLCKRRLLVRFLSLWPHLRSLHDTEVSIEHNYRQIKRASGPYMEALHAFKKAFKAADLGKWMKKPLEQDLFCATVEELQPVSTP